MKYLKTITTNGKTEYINADKIISIVPNGDTIKILCGAGLYWNVRAASLEWIESPGELLLAIASDRRV